MPWPNAIAADGRRAVIAALRIAIPHASGLDPGDRNLSKHGLTSFPEAAGRHEDEDLPLDRGLLGLNGGRSRKPLWAVSSTVGSNPTPSAVDRTQCLHRAEFRPPDVTPRARQ